MRRPGRRAAMVATIWQASSTVEAVPLPCQRRAATGRQTGRVMNGSRTTTPTTTHRWPKASLLRLGADPSWIHDAPWTFLPRRRWAVSSTAITITASASTRWATIRSSTIRPTASIDHTARAKNRWTRSCDQVGARPAPASIPQTVLLPVRAIMPTTIAVNTTSVGLVKHPAKASNNRRSEAGKVRPGSIGGSLSVTTVVLEPPMLLSSHPKITHPKLTTRVTPTRPRKARKSRCHVRRGPWKGPTRRRTELPCESPDTAKLIDLGSVEVAGLGPPPRTRDHTRVEQFHPVEETSD